MTSKADLARRLIEQRGLTIERFGRGYRVFGKDVDMLVENLMWLQEADLRPTGYEIRRPWARR
jgi:hypothetical protein